MYIQDGAKESYLGYASKQANDWAIQYSISLRVEVWS